jgi:hypothetical protein
VCDFIYYDDKEFIMSSSIAYYKDGVPYSANGYVVITITGRPVSQVGWPGSNPNPVYVNWPGAGSIPRGGGIVDYNPKKLPFTGLYYMREGQKKIDNILDKAKKDYPKNVD